MNITISGDIGAGKSTLGSMLADRLGFELVDCGQLYRELVAEKGNTVLEQYRGSGKTIDEQVDEAILDMCRDDVSRIYISRTAWHLVPNAVNIYLSVNPYIGARRVLNRKFAGENFSDINEAVRLNRERQELEDKRYFELYSITREQQMKSVSIYVFVGEQSPAAVCNAIISAISSPKPVYLFDPKSAFPTTNSGLTLRTLFDTRSGIDPSPYVKMPVRLQLTDGYIYILDGHTQVIAACFEHVSFVAAESVQYSANYEAPDIDYSDWESMTGYLLPYIHHGDL
ncbi:MAG: dephospho-CoA kinase [Lachnospiraceae bacterium]|nr:dephospho-CoA kinase [Lachnospiraceae bacterium]